MGAKNTHHPTNRHLYGGLSETSQGGDIPSSVVSGLFRAIVGGNSAVVQAYVSQFVGEGFYRALSDLAGQPLPLRQQGIRPIRFTDISRTGYSRGTKSRGSTDRLRVPNGFSSQLIGLMDKPSGRSGVVGHRLEDWRRPSVQGRKYSSIR